MATFEELQRVCKHHHGRADDFEGMETPIQNHTLRCWNCLVSLEPIPADVVAQVRAVVEDRVRLAHVSHYDCESMIPCRHTPLPCSCGLPRAEAILVLLPKP